MPALLDEKHEWVRTHSFPKFAKIGLATHYASDYQPSSFSDSAQLNKLVRQTDLLVDLKCARLNTDRLRVRSRRFVFVEDHKVDAVPYKLTCECQARRPG